LAILKLSFNQIEDDGAFAIANVINGNTKMAVLDLMKNRIGDEGIAALNASKSAGLALFTQYQDPVVLDTTDPADDIKLLGHHGLEFFEVAEM